jgi:hypothetical protein
LCPESLKDEYLSRSQNHAHSENHPRHQHTFAKESTKPSETLSASQKQFVKAGEEFKIKSYIKLHQARKTFFG